MPWVSGLDTSLPSLGVLWGEGGKGGLHRPRDEEGALKAASSVVRDHGNLNWGALAIRRGCFLQDLENDSEKQSVAVLKVSLQTAVWGVWAGGVLPFGVPV